MTSGLSNIEKSAGSALPSPRLALVRVALGAVALIGASCGQEDPAFRPDAGNTVRNGAILVSSSVPGAAITLDGIATGRVTPDTLREVSASLHRVRIFLGGYSPDPMEWQQEVVADSLHSAHFDLILVQGAGSIAVEAPYPADIFLDGVATGLAAPDTVAGVGSGEHAVTLVLPGFDSVPAEVRLTVLADLVVDADFDLIAPKMVVCEDFSNYGCLPCVPADAALRAALEEIRPRHAISLNPHLPFPVAGDPIYTFNPEANDARAILFPVFAMPAIFANGNRISEPTSSAAIQAAIEAELALPAPMAIGVRTALGSTDFRTRVDVWAVTEGIPANLFLFTCVVETVVTLEPPGPNGLSEYRNVIRHFFRPPNLPGDWGGEDLGELRPGDRKTFEYVYPLPGGVDPARLAVIAFAQERTGARRVFQVGTSPDL